MKPIAIVGCGAQKRDTPALAGDMYTSQYFRACYQAAIATAPGRVFILSALHGLMRPWQQIQPYNLRLGGEGSITPGRLLTQAQREGVLGADVVALCGADYAGLIEQVWTGSTVTRPLQGLGIGRQKHRLMHLANGAWDCGFCSTWPVAKSAAAPRAAAG